MKRRQNRLARGYCRLCRGDGFVRISAREHGTTHGGGLHVTTKKVDFRAACECSTGKQWYRERCKATASGGLPDGGP